MVYFMEIHTSTLRVFSNKATNPGNNIGLRAIG
jgi:hypothetical protein